MKLIIEGDSNDGRVFTVSNNITDTVLKKHKLHTKRASHVEPAEDGWKVDLSPIGINEEATFETRDEALSHEVDIIYSNLSHYGKCLFDKSSTWKVLLTRIWRWLRWTT